MKQIPYEDLHKLPENERIKRIALELCFGKTIAFFCDDEPKADRYIALLKKELPGCNIEAKFAGPGGTVGVRVSGAKG